jgi:hypothetical protein
VTDAADKVDIDEVARVSRYVTDGVGRLDGLPLGAASPEDTTELELARWRSCWTPIGLPPELCNAPADRAQIDALVQRIVRHLGM